MGISALLASQILDASATGRSVLTGADASAIRTTLGLGTLATQSPTGTPSASTFLRGDFSWQTIDLSGYLTLTGGTMTGQLTITQGTANTSVLTSTGYSLTGSNAQSLLDVAGTWNTTGTPTLIKANVTDTASNAASLLLDLQVGGTSRFKVQKNGSVVGPAISALSSTFGFSSNTGLCYNSSFLFMTLQGTSEAAFSAGIITRNQIRFSTSPDAVSSDCILIRDAANTLAQRNATNAQTFRVYNTFTDASNYERAKIAWESNVLRIGTEKAGTGSARALELQTDGTTRLTVGNTGIATYVGRAGASGGVTAFQITDNINATFRLSFENASRIMFSGNEGSHILSFGGKSGSETASPFTERFRVDNVSNAVQCFASLVVSAVNVVTDTTTGTKIGTATTQKLGFFNATPVVQPTAVANATDAASVITQLNALLSRVRDLGLIAT